nr:hypothetical protein [Salinispora arenicola]
MSLLGDLQAQVRRLSEDLRERSGEEPFAQQLVAEHFAAVKPPPPESPRTALSFAAWREDRIVQAAVAWVLSTVFVRFCEDNRLVDLPWIAGPGDRLELAVERSRGTRRAYPDQTDRDWLELAFTALTRSPVAAGLFDRAYNPLWTITPAHEGAKELLTFWRRRNADGTLVHDFTDWDTRNLGQLYQELSEHAKATYALLQTPEFVESFILDLTLEHGDRGVRSGGTPRYRPDLWVRALPHRGVPPVAGALASQGARCERLGADQALTRLRPRRGQESVRCGHRPVPAHG